jgi:hypothetical protein
MKGRQYLIGSGAGVINITLKESRKESNAGTAYEYRDANHS